MSSIEVPHATSGYAIVGAIADSVSYSSWVMPEYEARITSGSVSATASKSMPSVSSNSTGVSAPSSVELRLRPRAARRPRRRRPTWPSHMPTGTTPNASGTS